MEKKVSLEEVRHMARLSRLLIDHEEEEMFSRQFGRILGHMAVLENIDTEGVEPLFSPLTGSGRERLDIADNIRTVEEIMSNAPDTDGEYFIVPKIV